MTVRYDSVQNLPPLGGCNIEGVLLLVRPSHIPRTCKKYVANFSQPHIRIWNSVSLTTLCVIGNGEFDGSICCLSFSKADGGNYLCAIDETSDHNISIWDWQKGERGTKVTETKVRSNQRWFRSMRGYRFK